MEEVYIQKVCNGDTDAFRYFIKTYKDMAFSVAISVVKDEFTAEEVVQDAFLKAFKGLRTFNRKSKFSTWFYRIVTNEALQRLKKDKREMVFAGSGYNDDILDESLVTELKEDEQVYLINEALKKLPPKESLVLRLFYLQEESIKAVCEITGWTESNAKVILYRARKSMLIAINEIRNTEF